MRVLFTLSVCAAASIAAEGGAVSPLSLARLRSEADDSFRDLAEVLKGAGAKLEAPSFS